MEGIAEETLEEMMAEISSIRFAMFLLDLFFLFLSHGLFMLAASIVLPLCPPSDLSIP